MIAAVAVLGVGALLLMRSGIYGLTLFLVVPLLLGVLACLWRRPSDSGGAAAIGAFASMAGCAVLLLLGLDGVICVMMAVPLAVPLGMLGALIAYGATKRSSRISTLALLPFATLTADLTSRPETFQVTTSIEVDAPPPEVWRHVVAFTEIPEPDEWYFRAGIAYPKRARIEGSGPGAIRYCEFSTGAFVEPIETWHEGRLLAFRVTSNPAPMEEWTFYGRIFPKHLHGFLVSERGQFLLSPAGPNRTRIEGTTWYRHGLWPAAYWRLWSDAIIHRIHRRVLEHVAQRAAPRT